MKRILPALFLGFAVACGGSSETEGEALIRTTVIRSAEVTLDTFASPTGTLIHGEGIAPNSPDGTGEIKEFNGYRTATDLVFRIEVTEGFSFGTDLHEIVLQNVIFNGESGRMVFNNIGNPSEAGRTRGVATFVTNSGQFLPTGIQVTQWMDDADDLYFFMSVPLAAFTFIREDDTNSVFSVVLIIQRGTTPPINTDYTADVNVDFVDLP